MTDILQHFDAGVLTLTIDRVDKKNSLIPSMYATLAGALTAAATNPEVRVVVFAGHERIFSAGNDIADFLNNPPVGQDAPVFQFLHALAAFPKPAIAAVCGAAVGIGTTMLFHCDLVFAGDNAQFAMPFVNLGLCPEAASSLLAPQLMGYHRAAEALLLGEPFGADAAVAMGLVNRVTTPAEVLTLAQTTARKLAAKPLSSLIATKQLLKGGQHAAVMSRMAEEGEVFARMLREPAAKEAFGAFLEKRKPDFSKV